MHSHYNDPYKNYNPDSFLIKAKRTVYKWWCVVYRPMYKLVHNGVWPEAKNPENVYPTVVPTNNDAATRMAEQIIQLQNDNIDNLIAETLENTKKEAPATAPDIKAADNASASAATAEPEIDLSKVDSDTLDRANEIMARLAREAAEDEAKKQAEIDLAKKQADENARLAMIMQANKVDISSFIEEGKAHQVKQEISEA